VCFRADSVIAIVEARKLLGEEALTMSDEEIRQLIDDFDMIAQYSIKLVQNLNNNEDITD
jgi:hypothetical protein